MSPPWTNIKMVDVINFFNINTWCITYNYVHLLLRCEGFSAFAKSIDGQNDVMEEPLENSVAFCNNPIPKDQKCLRTSFCLWDNVAKPLFEQTEVSPDTENFVNLSR